MSDPFYTYPSETTKQLDALLGTPALGPDEWCCSHHADVSEIPETLYQGMGQSMTLTGYKGTYRNPQPCFPECPTCPHFRGASMIRGEPPREIGPMWLCNAHGIFMLEESR